jgi:hypothetical protein
MRSTPGQAPRVAAKQNGQLAAAEHHLRTAPQWRLSGPSPTTVTPRVIQSDTDVDTALLYWARGRHRRHARGEATRGSSTPDTPDLAVTAAAPQQELGEPHRSTLFATG